MDQIEKTKLLLKKLEDEKQKKELEMSVRLPMFKEDLKIGETQIMLIAQEQNLFQRMAFFPFTLLNKFDGWILWEKTPKQYKLLKIKNYSILQKIDRHAMILNQAEGILDGKPFFIVKNKIPISVNTHVHSNPIIYYVKDKTGKEIKKTEMHVDGIDLCYDTESYYTMMDYVNIKYLEAHGKMQPLSTKAIIIIALIIIGAIILFFTPIGKDLLAQLAPHAAKPTGV